MKLYIVVASGLLSTAPASAQVAAPSQPAGLKAVAACRSITDAAARLACYDSSVAQLSQSVAAREIVVLDRQEVRRTRRSLFGFSLPRLPFLGGDGDNDGQEAVREITANIVRAAAVGNDRYQVTLDDGAVWRTTEAVRNVPRAGRAVTLRRAALGSFWMDYGSGRAVRAMRIK